MRKIGTAPAARAALLAIFGQCLATPGSFAPFDGDEAQEAGSQKPAFDVVSIKYSGTAVPGRVPRSIRFKGGRLTCDETLARLIRTAYHLEQWEYSAPFSLEFEYYEVQAIAPPNTSNATRDLMLQTMLEQRLGLKYHREDRQLPIYALLVDKGGLRLQAGTEPAPGQIRQMSNGVFKSNSSALSELAGFLTHTMDRPVIDMTGANGKYRIELDWSGALKNAPPDPDEPTVVSGMRISSGPRLTPAQVSSDLRRIGLRIEARKLAVKVLVVDHVNKQPTPN
jgi:uncharacterized protein (TIGR03435 family)